MVIPSLAIKNPKDSLGVVNPQKNLEGISRFSPLAARLSRTFGILWLCAPGLLLVYLFSRSKIAKC